jgi:hypothetical protein
MSEKKNDTMTADAMAALDAWSDGAPANQIAGMLLVAVVDRDEAVAKIEKLREALDEIFTRISYINIHGVGEQPEPTGIPQPMRASPDEFRRIWQEIGNLAGAALDETK